METIYSNASIKNIPIVTLRDLKLYLNMTDTDRAKMIAVLICPSMKAIDKNLFYVYNEKTCIWSSHGGTDFENYTMELLNQVTKDMKKFVKTLDDCDWGKEDDKYIKACYKKHDEKKYQGDMASKIWSFILDSNFVTNLDKSPYMLSLKNGTKIDLRDASVSQRIKEDYLTYESDVNLKEKTPHADKFFKQIRRTRVYA